VGAPALRRRRAPDLQLPEEYRVALIARAGEPARRWLESLPETVDDLANRWSFRLRPGPARHGWLGVVFLARRGDEQCALKLSWSDADVPAEAAGLRAWAGRGAVRLLASDLPARALLLEGLDPTRTLADLSPFNAAAVAGSLIRELAVPADSEVPTSLDVLDGICRTLQSSRAATSGRVPIRVIDAARATAGDLAAMAPSHTLADIDLHYRNVLAGARRPWLAIDPKPVAGPPEMSVPELVWTRIDDVPGRDPVASLLSAVVDGAGLDIDLARAWTVVRTTEYWLWALDSGLTEDPRRCARVLEHIS
jgi:streptomycin 6-kinase